MRRRVTGHGFLLMVILAGCQAAPQETPTAGADDNRVLITQYFAEFDNEPSLEVLDRWLTADFVSHEAGTGRTIYVREMLIFRIADGKVAEERIMFDTAGFLEQLQG